MLAGFLRRVGIVPVILVGTAAPAMAQTAGFKQMPTPAMRPGEIMLESKGVAQANQSEAWIAAGESLIVHNVSEATLTPFFPPVGKANGTAVVIAPGGGFMILSMSSEGYDVARYLASKGITAFVLKYRLLPTPASTAGTFAALTQLLNGRDPVAFKRHLNAGAALATDDAMEAMRVVRARAAEWGIDPGKIGFMGFSAGAITTMELVYRADPAAMPGFIAPIYGILDAPDRTLPRALPPMWAAIAADDPLLGKSDLRLITAWRDSGGAVEFHLFEKGGHGFGLAGQPGTTTILWPQQFLNWLGTRGLYSPAP